MLMTMKKIPSHVGAPHLTMTRKTAVGHVEKEAGDVAAVAEAVTLTVSRLGDVGLRVTRTTVGK